MIKHNQDGAVNVLLIPLVLVVVLFVAALSFGYWSYASRQDYKNNADQKVAAAVTVAVAQESTTKDKQFAQTEKQPLTSYSGPEAYGSIVVKYPKTWSSYVDTTGSQTAVDGYFDPGTVPAISDPTNNFALRLQVIDQSYSSVLTTLTSQQQSSDSTVTISPYALPKLPSVVGVRVEGAIQPNKNGSMVILPLRDKTIELWTEAAAYENDFDNNVLLNFTFSP